MISVPKKVETILQTLENAGFEAYAVGGAVRDSLLGKMPGDWDLCSAATPEQAHALFPQVLDTGLRHGTVTILSENERFELTTFRLEGSYPDHRRPASVTFTESIRADLSRRDFTVNAMAYSPGRGLIDPFGGQRDLRAGVIRTVGAPELRFRDDALRILRGLRFSSELGFSIDPETGREMQKQRQSLSLLSAERVQQELWKMLKGQRVAPILREYRDVFAVILPELAPMFDFNQHNPHHIYDVWEHTLHTVEQAGADPLLRLTMLLHDCAKPARFTVDFRGDGHFYGHAPAGAIRAKQALNRLRFDGETVARVSRLIHYHDHDLLATERSLLYWLNLLGEEDLHRLIRIKIADNQAQNPRYDRTAAFYETEKALDTLLARNPCYRREMLAVNGRDLQALGLRGKAIGQTLDALLHLVMDGTVPNERQALLAAVK